MKKYTLVHRFLHWTIGIGMLVLFTTGFLRMEWMSKKNLSSLIVQETSKEGVSLSEATLKTIGKNSLKPMWEWHELFAYIILGLFVLRIVYMIVKGIRFPNPFKHSAPKEKFQGLIYLIFYGLVLIESRYRFLLNVGKRNVQRTNGRITQNWNLLVSYFLPNTYCRNCL